MYNFRRDYVWFCSIIYGKIGYNFEKCDALRKKWHDASLVYFEFTFGTHKEIEAMYYHDLIIADLN